MAGILARDERDDARAEKLFRAAVAANPRNADAVRELKQIQRKRNERAEGASRGRSRG